MPDFKLLEKKPHELGIIVYLSSFSLIAYLLSKLVYLISLQISYHFNKLLKNKI